MILRYIYNKNKKRFHDFFLEDLLKDIPKNVAEQGVEMMAEKRDIITRLLYWQAHVVHRRDPSDFINMERKMGILTQIKLLLVILGNAPKGEEEHPVVGKTVAPPEDWKEPVENFKKRIIKKK